MLAVQTQRVGDNDVLSDLKIAAALEVIKRCAFPEQRINIVLKPCSKETNQGKQGASRQLLTDALNIVCSQLDDVLVKVKKSHFRDAENCDFHVFDFFP